MSFLLGFWSCVSNNDLIVAIIAGVFSVVVVFIAAKIGFDSFVKQNQTQLLHNNLNTFLTGVYFIGKNGEKNEMKELRKSYELMFLYNSEKFIIAANDIMYLYSNSFSEVSNIHLKECIMNKGLNIVIDKKFFDKEDTNYNESMVNDFYSRRRDIITRAKTILLEVANDELKNPKSFKKIDSSKIKDRYFDWMFKDDEK